MTSTLEQSTGAVLGVGDGDRVGDRSPQSKKPPSTGAVMVITGAVLPTVMTVVLASVLPPESVTVSLAV